MEITIIVAMTPQGLIGSNNQIPWHLPADLKRFKKVTMGCPLIMGRKTFESLPGVLPGRPHIILTRNRDYVAKNCTTITSWGQVDKLCRDVEKIFIIGGAEIYEYALSFANNLLITSVHAEVEGEIFFPHWDQSQWHEIERIFREKDEKNAYDMEFIKYERIFN